MSDFLVLFTNNHLLSSAVSKRFTPSNITMIILTCGFAVLFTCFRIYYSKKNLIISSRSHTATTWTFSFDQQQNFFCLLCFLFLFCYTPRPLHYPRKCVCVWVIKLSFKRLKQFLNTSRGFMVFDFTIEMEEITGFVCICVKHVDVYSGWKHEAVFL